MRPTTTRETLAMLLSEWARKTGGYVEIRVYHCDRHHDYCEADLYHKTHYHSYHRGSLDQVLHDVDQELGL